MKSALNKERLVNLETEQDFNLVDLGQEHRMIDELFYFG